MNRSLFLLFGLALAILLGNCGKDSPTEPEVAEDKWFSLPPLNNLVSAITVFNGDLVVGGSFTEANGVSMNYITRWDGSNWQDVGGGVSSGSQNITAVLAMTVYNNQLIVAGRFNQAGTVSARSIATWDGNSWRALGSGIDATALSQGPMSLTAYQGNLIVGGYFNDAGGVPADDIASWNGSAWSEFAGGISGGSFGEGVHSLIVFDNNLVAAGNFTKADTVTVSNIAIWNGNAWNDPSSGIDGTVWAMSVFGNNLVAGGMFSMAGGIGAGNIAIWDRTIWTACGSGLSDRMDGLTVYNGKLIAGGFFTNAGGVSARAIASWNGSSWSPLGKGVAGGILGLTDVDALHVHDGKLYVGGNFTTAGEKSVGYIAGWQD